MHVCFPASCIPAKKRVLCICSSNMGHEALCIWSENENSASFALTTCTSKKLSVCRASGEWVIMDLSLKRPNIWVFICLQGTLQPQTRCLQCGDTLEWSEEHGCVCVCVCSTLKQEKLFFSSTVELSALTEAFFSNECSEAFVMRTSSSEQLKRPTLKRPHGQECHRMKPFALD